MKAAIVILASVLLLGVAYLCLWPVPVDPVAWTPPPMPRMEGVLAPNTRLTEATLLAEGEVSGPEDIAFDSEGMLYTGTKDGRVLRIDPRSGAASPFAEVPGGTRVGGIAFDDAGNLLACVIDVGLVSFSPDGRMQTLVGRVQGRQLHSPNELVIAPDRTVYFTELTHRKPVNVNEPEEFFEHRPRGSVFAYDRGSKAVSLVQDGLYMANGIELAPDGRSLLVVENPTFSIRRIWIDGSGRPPELFVDSLPGVADNISFADDGLLWVALAVPRSEELEQLMEHPFAMKVLVRLLRLAPVSVARAHGFAIALDEDGRVVHSLQDPSGETLSHITSVVRHGDHLYFGSYHTDAVGRLPAPRSEP